MHLVHGGSGSAALGRDEDVGVMQTQSDVRELLIGEASGVAEEVVADGHAAVGGEGQVAMARAAAAGGIGLHPLSQGDEVGVSANGLVALKVGSGGNIVADPGPCDGVNVAGTSTQVGHIGLLDGVQLQDVKAVSGLAARTVLLLRRDKQGHKRSGGVNTCPHGSFEDEGCIFIRACLTSQHRYHAFSCSKLLAVY